MRSFPAEEIAELAGAALRAAGASEEVADVLVDATMHAEFRGKSALGVRHLFDYLDAMRAGRLDGRASPDVRAVMPSLVTADARAGVAQLAFEHAYPELQRAVATTGMCFLSITSSYTVGELGYYTRRLARSGVFALAGANSPALMSFGGSPVPLIGTNPLAYACRVGDGRLLSVDQASSTTAYVSVRSAAERGIPVPDNCAVDSSGRVTTDAVAALGGALLPFGGFKGGNIALLIELLSVAAGSNWSLDAPPFDRGDRSPGVGMFVVAIDVDRLHVDRLGTRLPQRLLEHFEHLAEIGGIDTEVFMDRVSGDLTTITVDDADHARLIRAAQLR